MASGRQHLTMPSSHEHYLPTETQNSLTLSLLHGEFSKHKNIQITVEVRNSKGSVIEGAFLSTGGVRADRVSSLVLQNTLSPAWDDTFRLDLDVDSFRQGHLFFVLRNFLGKDKSGTVVAFASLPLVNVRTGTVLADGERTLHCQKLDDVATLRPSDYLEHVGGECVFELVDQFFGGSSTHTRSNDRQEQTK